MSARQETQKARRKVERVLKLLEKRSARPKRVRSENPLEELVIGVLEDGGSLVGAQSALAGLKREFVDWNELRVSDPRDVASVIKRTPEPEKKAEVLKEILRVLFAQHHGFTLQEVSDERFTRKQAAKFLARFPSLGEHAKARLMLLSMGVDELPVNAEMLRVAKRVGMMPAELRFEDASSVLSQLVSRRRYYACYQVLTEHGQNVCLRSRLNCDDCAVGRECDTCYEASSRKRTRR